MQNNAIYMRSLIQTMAGKAIRDLRSGGERELRNVMELCKGRSPRPGYRKFWNMLEESLRVPGQRYGALLARAANDVDIHCLKTLVANLGIPAYTDGGEPQRNSQNIETASAYWMEPLDGTMEPETLHRSVAAFQQQGTSTFFVRVGQERELKALLNLAGRYRQCVFVPICRGTACCPADLEEMAALGNVVPLLGYPDLPSLAGQLKDAGILFGFHRRYTEIEGLEAEERMLHQCTAAGCFLGVYEGSRQTANDKQDRLYYTKLQELRRNGTKEIILCDLWRDREQVQMLLHPQSRPENKFEE